MSRLRLAWWNSGLVGRKDPKPDEIAAASEVIRALQGEGACDLVAVCEVRPSYVQDLAKKVLENSQHTVLTTQPLNRPAHDFALFYNPVLLGLEEPRLLTASSAGHSVCAALECAMRVPRQQDPLRLALCHWPALGMGDQNHAEITRQESASTLRAALRVDGGAFRDCLVLGDFNAEPFDTPLLALGGTRDFERVRAQPDLLYNLSWRWLGSSPPYDGRGTVDHAGTYCLEGGKESCWRTFDQALVSARFLRGQGWTLREDESSIRHLQALRGSRGAYLRKQFDHLPVVVTLEYI